MNKLITILRKPLGKLTVAQCVLTHGTGGLNIDASRIGGEFVSAGGNNFDAWRSGEGRTDRPKKHAQTTSSIQMGRWPANVILTEQAAKALDADVGEEKSEFFFIIPTES